MLCLPFVHRGCQAWMTIFIGKYCNRGPPRRRVTRSDHGSLPLPNRGFRVKVAPRFGDGAKPRVPPLSRFRSGAIAVWCPWARTLASYRYPAGHLKNPSRGHAAVQIFRSFLPLGRGRKFATVHCLLRCLGTAVAAALGVGDWVRGQLCCTWCCLVNCVSLQLVTFGSRLNNDIAGGELAQSLAGASLVLCLPYNIPASRSHLLNMAGSVWQHVFGCRPLLR